MHKMHEIFSGLSPRQPTSLISRHVSSGRQTSFSIVKQKFPQSLDFVSEIICDDPRTGSIAGLQPHQSNLQATVKFSQRDG